MTNKLRWGLIGCGDIARKRVAPALRDLANCDLVAVARNQSDLAASFAREFGARKWYGGWEQLIADDEIGAVYVATPVDLHARQTIRAAERGKHVMCEKPMAMDPAECDRMIAACRASKVKLGVAYYRHFYPVIARIKEIVRSGEIGQPVLAQINAFEWFNPEPGHPRHWLIQQQRAGGGPMFDFGCHRVEVLLNILGPIRQTYGIVHNVVFKREVEDTATALFEFESGVRGMLTVTHASRESQDTLDIFGSGGSVHVRVLNDGVVEVTTGGGVRSETHSPNANLHLPLIDDFTRAVIDSREPLVDGLIGREVASIIEKVYRSTGKREH
jgi:predicted dehydrogenase